MFKGERNDGKDLDQDTKLYAAGSNPSGDCFVCSMCTWCGQGRRGRLCVLFRVGLDFTTVGEAPKRTSGARLFRVGSGRGKKRMCFASERILEKSYQFLHFWLWSFFAVFVRKGVPFVAPVVTVVPLRVYRNNITWCIDTWIRPSRSRVGVLGIHLGTSSHCAFD